MSETDETNIKLASELNQAQVSRNFGGSPAASRAHYLLEEVEAVVLALVAVATAWSGYQAARWDGVQSQLYGRSSRFRVEGQSPDLQANQEKMYDAATVAEWLKAEVLGEARVEELFERRVLPEEFRPAFDAWKRTDPVHNPNAPAGPALMPAYRNAVADEAMRKNQESTELFEQGTRARERADAYVRVTVYLATVLLWTAIGQRFRSVQIRTTLVAVAFRILCIPIWFIFTLPRT
jgi:hypothetical protein